MKLELRNGYPRNAASISEKEREAQAENAPNISLDLEGVIHFEWLHTVTVQFADVDAFLKARHLTGWSIWSSGELILEAPTSEEEGYAHPAIIARDYAYCGFILTP